MQQLHISKYCTIIIRMKSIVSSKLVNYVKPIAERMEFFRLYFNAQKLLVFILIHIRRNMNMPSMNH